VEVTDREAAARNAAGGKDELLAPGTATLRSRLGGRYFVCQVYDTVLQRVGRLQSKLHFAGESVGMGHDTLEVLRAFHRGCDEHVKLVDNSSCQKRAVGTGSTFNDEMPDAKVPGEYFEHRGDVDGGTLGDYV
jgi:hypothetical protein